jgi:cellulose synthase/poly-beta-1,6-N-acetylglucosamine synthase-like glycosyltransferase
MLLIATATFLLLYAVLIHYYFYHWLHVKEFKIVQGQHIFVSVVIAARNEEKNIANVLNALLQQSYPSKSFEIIIVDDYSTDNTAGIAQSFLNDRVHLIQPKVDAVSSSKKKAIEAGIKKANGELIVITDADCVPEINWLQAIVSFREKNKSAFVAAPVRLKLKSSMLSVFQTLDFITLQGITAASVSANMHSMCNGANLAYLRSAFFEVDGFKGIDKLASGDDMLLMYKIWQNHPHRVHYLKNKEAIVETEPMHSWKDFFAQRLRWSSKATYYQDWRITGVLFFVYLFNCLFLTLIITAFFDVYYWWVLLFYLIGKILIELPFVYSVAKFYEQRRLVVFFPLLQPLHILYTIITGFVSQLGSYQWKGRKTK